MVSSKIREALGEGTLRDPIKHLDLLPDKEVNPGWIVSNNELLVTEEFLDLFHIVADIYYGLFVTSTVHMTTSLSLDV